MDFEFSPFDDHLLLSASEDLTLKLWQIPSDGLTQHLKDTCTHVTAYVAPCCDHSSCAGSTPDPRRPWQEGNYLSCHVG